MRNIRTKKVSENFLKMATPVSNVLSRRSLGNEDVGEFFYISIDKINPFFEQSRSIFDEDEIRNLACTIKEHGVRNPLTVIRHISEDGKYEVISGERRLRAAKLAGLEKVPCFIIEDRQKAREIALIENIQRKDLHPIELALGIQNIMRNMGSKTQRDLAKTLGLPESKVSELLKLAEIPETIKNFLLENNITSRNKIRNIVREFERGNFQEQKNISVQKNLKILIHLKDGEVIIDENILSQDDHILRNKVKNAILDFAEKLSK